MDPRDSSQTLAALADSPVGLATFMLDDDGKSLDLNVTLPVAVSVFPHELYQPPRSWVEKAYPRLVRHNKLDRGGHFAGWEQPQLLVDELRAGFRSLR